MANNFKFKTIFDENGSVNTLNCPIDIFSTNASVIHEWISELNGRMENCNTAHFSSVESFSEFSRRLSTLTLPILSKKR